MQQRFGSKLINFLCEAGLFNINLYFDQRAISREENKILCAYKIPRNGLL